MTFRKKNQMTFMKYNRNKKKKKRRKKNRKKIRPNKMLSQTKLMINNKNKDRENYENYIYINIKKNLLKKFLNK